MYDIAVLISRYAFALYAVMFICGIILYAAKSGGARYLMTSALMLTHVTAFSLLALNSGEDILRVLIICFSALAVISVYSFFSRKHGDPLITNGVLFLIDIGLICLTRLNTGLAVKQVASIAAGAAAAMLVPFLMRKLKFLPKLWAVYLLTGISIVASVLVLGSEIYGAKNWIAIGGFSFQPSEIAKLLFVFYLAAFFKNEPSLRRQLFGCASAAAFVLVLVVQKDLGGAVIFFLTFVLMFYVAGGKKILIFMAAAGAVAAMLLGYRLFPQHFGHITYRIDGWLNPFKHADSSGYQLIMSLFAICTYLPFGSGLTRGYSSKIPFVEKDFIFAAVTEELGLFIALALIAAYGALVYSGIKSAKLAKTRFVSLSAFGFSALLAVQVFVILGANIGLLPITGVTLPLVSYGGTSAFVSLVMSGILQYAHSEAITGDDEDEVPDEQ